jgi:hypothetical protein
LVRKFTRVENDLFLQQLPDLIKKHFYRFFNIVTLSEDYELVKFDKSINRIILVNYLTKFIISSGIKTHEKD